MIRIDKKSQSPKIQKQAMTKKGIIFLLGLVWFGTGFSVQAQWAVDRQELLEEVAQTVEEYYIFQDKGQALGQALRTIGKEGTWNNLKDNALGDSITTLLRTKAQDQHFSLFHYRPFSSNSSVYEELSALHNSSGTSSNYGFDQVEILPANIGYIKYKGFDDAKESKVALAATMNFVTNTEALIIDVSNNPGGDPKMVLLFCSYFYQQPTLLSTTHYRQEQLTLKNKTKAKVKGKKYLNKPIYILTSSHSFSAAEAFCYHLQQGGRAIIVGEKTAGAANPVELFVIQDNFAFFVPVGQESSAVTGSSWEQIGVVPNVTVPAQEALEQAQLHLLTKRLQAATTPKLYHSTIQERITALEQSMHK